MLPLLNFSKKESITSLEKIEDSTSAIGDLLRRTHGEIPNYLNRRWHVRGWHRGMEALHRETWKQNHARRRWSLLVTNPERLQAGIDGKYGNSILIKLNQIGTVSRDLDAIKSRSRKRYEGYYFSPKWRNRGYVYCWSRCWSPVQATSKQYSLVPTELRNITDSWESNLRKHNHELFSPQIRTNLFQYRWSRTRWSDVVDGCEKFPSSKIFSETIWMSEICVCFIIAMLAKTMVLFELWGCKWGTPRYDCAGYKANTTIRNQHSKTLSG